MSDNIESEKLSLIWLDDSPDDSQDNNTTQNQLRVLDSNLKVFQNKTDFDAYISSQSADACITLIVNGKLGQQVVPEMDKAPQILAIYIFCMNKEVHQQWSKPYTKVKDVLVEFEVLKKRLQPLKTTDGKHSIIEEVPLVDPIQSIIIELEARYGLDCSYMISDSCFDYLVRMKMIPNAKDEYIALCQDALKENEQLMPIIREFSENYSADQAISWLSRDPFFYGFIDNIFKYSCIAAMYPCRVLIHDIQKQLEQHKCKSTVHVYYYDIMPNDMFEQFKNFKGKVIAMKSFFWTNLDREVVLTYLPDKSPSNECKRILLTIEADPKTANVKPFAKLDFLGGNNDPKSVLFMIGSLFKITEIEDEKDDVVNIKMTLCADDNTNQLKISFDQLKNQYIDSNGETDVIGYGKLLYDIGNSMNSRPISGTGEQFIRSCCEKLSNDDPDRPRWYDALGNINFVKGDLDESLNWYKKSFEIRKQKLPENDPILADSYKNMAEVYLKKKDYKEALKYFNQLLTTWKKTHGEDNNILIPCYTNLATIHEAEERQSDAISCYHLALAIIAKNSSNEDPRLGFIYQNLANVYNACQDYHLALGYYNASLEMKLKLCTTRHPSVALTYRNIGIVYQYMGNIQQAQEHFKKAADIYHEFYQAGDPHLVEIEELIQSLTTEAT